MSYSQDATNRPIEQIEAFPTAEASGRTLDRLLQMLTDQYSRIMEGLERLQKAQSLSVVKESYTTEEVAERLGRAEWTVRQWCNKGKAEGAYKVHGKGRTGEWRIPHEFIVRFQNELLTPSNRAA
jgi:hypothetical protein